MASHEQRSNKEKKKPKQEKGKVAPPSPFAKSLASMSGKNADKKADK